MPSVGKKLPVTTSPMARRDLSEVLSAPNIVLCPTISLKTVLRSLKSR